MVLVEPEPGRVMAYLAVLADQTADGRVARSVESLRVPSDPVAPLPPGLNLAVASFLDP